MDKQIKQFYNDHSPARNMRLNEEASQRVKENIFSKLGTVIQNTEPVSKWDKMRGVLLRGYVLVPLVVVLFLAGTTYASAHALPGDTLYPVKRQVENARILIAPTEEAKEELEVRFAQKRLDELEKIQRTADPAEEKDKNDDSTSNKGDGNDNNRRNRAEAEASKALDALQQTQHRWQERGNSDKAQKFQQKVDQFKDRLQNRHENQNNNENRGRGSGNSGGSNNGRGSGLHIRL